MLSQTASEALFFDALRSCRSESLSGMFFRGSAPSKWYSHHSGSAILAKSPCAKKITKSRLQGFVYGPEVVRKRRRGDRKSQRLLRNVLLGRARHISKASFRQRSHVLEPLTAACVSRTPGNTLSSNGAESLGAPVRAGNDAPTTTGARFSENRF